MVHWHFDETMALERMRETERQANRAQAVGLFRREVPTAWLRLQRRLGYWLIALGQYLQRGEETRRNTARTCCESRAAR
ncbi:MAG: hypothetical protein ACRDIC_05100 [bacterium]